MNYKTLDGRTPMNPLHSGCPHWQTVFLSP